MFTTRMARPGRRWPTLRCVLNSARRQQLLALVSIVAVSVNLRPAVNALGAVMPELRPDMRMSGFSSGLLLALPTLSFALFGWTAPTLARRFGQHRVLLSCLVAITAGQLLRALCPGIWVLFAGSLLAMVGIAIANVLLPGLVRTHFPDRVPALTALYTTVLALGGGAAGLLTVPLQEHFGGTWHLGLGQWAAVSAMAVIPWVLAALTEHRRPDPPPAHHLPVLALRRSPVAWSLVCFFGAQSLLAYTLFGWAPDILVAAGLSNAYAAAMVSLLSLVGIPISALVPLLVRRLARPTILIYLMAGCYLLGFSGLIFAPACWPWLWGVLFGIGGGAFPLALTLIGLRARTRTGTSALSGFTQSTGYLLASLGPVTFGLLHDVTGTWTWPLASQFCWVLVYIVSGLAALRPRYVEDDLR